jgi:hypothetical protein
MTPDAGKKLGRYEIRATAILQRHSTPGVVLGTVGYMRRRQLD